MFVCALFGAGSYGIRGLFLGAVIGFAAPAALVWLSVLALGIIAYMLVYCATFAAIWTVFWWFLHQ